MEYLAYIVAGFTIVQLLISLFNLIFNQKLSKPTELNDLVSVIIPARDEENNINHILSDLQMQDYHNIEVIVFNDQSTDKTADIVEQYAKKDPRIKLLSSSGLPANWLGKNYACHIGSQHARGLYYLFLDADVRISNDLIIRTAYFLEKEKLGLLSIFPKQTMRTFGEYLTIPIMNYILLTLLPLKMVRKSNFASISAANGQFMLFNADIYQKYKPHEIMKNQKVEDIEIARYLKKQQIKIACLASNSDVSCRMYNNYRDAVTGFSKNVTTFFGNSTVLALLFWLVTTFGSIPVFLVYKIKGLLIYTIFVIITRLFVSLASNQSIILNILFHIPQQITVGYIILRSIQNKYYRKYKWKGRNIF